jgi:hypothetical protein
MNFGTYSNSGTDIYNFSDTVTDSGAIVVKRTVKIPISSELTSK